MNTYPRGLAAWTMVVLLLAGCAEGLGGGGGSSSGRYAAASTVPFTATVHPPDGATDAPLTTKALVVFSRPVHVITDPASTINGNTFLFNETASRKAVPGVYVQLSFTEVTFVPAASLTQLTNYTILLRDIKSIDGETLATIRQSFTTGTPTAPPLPPTIAGNVTLPKGAGGAVTKVSGTLSLPFAPASTSSPSTVAPAASSPGQVSGQLIVLALAPRTGRVFGPFIPDANGVFNAFVETGAFYYFLVFDDIDKNARVNAGDEFEGQAAVGGLSVVGTSVGAPLALGTLTLGSGSTARIFTASGNTNAATDTDGDGSKDDSDTDADGDGFSGIAKHGMDANNDGFADWATNVFSASPIANDADKDGIPDPLDHDVDNDGLPNDLDDDVNGDGAAESPAQLVAMGRKALSEGHAKLDTHVIRAADSFFAGAVRLDALHAEANLLRAATRMLLLAELNLPGAGETFSDANANNIRDPGESFIDANSNGRFDGRSLRDFADLAGLGPVGRSLFFSEPFTDGSISGRPANGKFDAESFRDNNDDDKFNATGESFVDANANGKRDEGEPFGDANGNGIFDAGERFADLNNNGTRNAAEAFTDADGDGRFDPADTFTPSGLFTTGHDTLVANGSRDAETFTDRNVNGKRDDHADFEIGRDRHDAEGRRQGVTLKSAFPDHDVFAKLARETIIPELVAIAQHLDQADVAGFNTTLSSAELLGDTVNDANGNNKRDKGEPFTDSNKNGVFDAGEPFTDKNANGSFDGQESFTDLNGDGDYDGSASKLAVEIDRADVKLMKVGVRLWGADLLIKCAYNLKLKMVELAAKDERIETQLDVIDAHPELGKLRADGAQLLALAKADLKKAIADYQAGSALLRAETDPQGDDLFVLRDPADNPFEQAEAVKDEENFRTNLAQVLAALDGQALITDEDFAQQDAFTDANGNGLWDRGESFTDLNNNGVRDAGEPFIDKNLSGTYNGPETLTVDHNSNGQYDTDRRDNKFNLNASIFLAGTLANLRTFLPSIVATVRPDEPDRRHNDVDAGSFASLDPTFGGVLPDETQNDLKDRHGKFGEIRFRPISSGGIGAQPSVSVPAQDKPFAAVNGAFMVLTNPGFSSNAVFECNISALNGSGADIRIHTKATSSFQVFTSIPGPLLFPPVFPNQTAIASASGVVTLDIDLGSQREFFTDTNSNNQFDAGESFEDWNRNKVHDAGLSRARRIFIIVPMGKTVEIDAIEALH